MSIFISDTLSGTAGTFLEAHTGALGATWTKVTGTATFQCTAGGRLRTAGGNSVTLYQASGLPARAPYDVQVDLVNLGDNATCLMGLFAHYTGVNSKWYAYYDARTNVWSLARDNSVVVSSVAATLNPAHTYTLLMQLRPGVVTMLVSDNGGAFAQVAQSVSGLDAAAGTCGVIGYDSATNTDSTGVQLANYVATDYTAPITGLALTPPSSTSGYVGAGSGVYALTLVPNGGVLATPATVTLSDDTDGVCAPAALVIGQDSGPATVVYVPNTAGTHTLSVANNAGLTNPAVPAYTAIAVPAGQICWNPVARQVAEADTSFGPLDGAIETTLVPAETGGMMTNPFNGLVNLSPPVGTAPGRYRLGHRPPDTVNFDAWWMPCEGLLNPDEWQVEGHVLSDGAWSAQTGSLFSIGAYGGSPPAALPFLLDVAVSGGQLAVRYVMRQGTVPYDVTRHLALGAPGWQAGLFTSLALQYKDGALTLLVNGAVVSWTEGAWTGVPVPAYIGATSGDSDALWLCHNGVTPMGTITLSDLRISRFVRPLNTAWTLPTPACTVSARVPSGAALNSTLAGGLHAPPVAALSSALMPGVVRALRLDKFMNPTPIKAGGTNAAHPTLGHTGAYSYDWQVVDRTCDRALGLLGAGGQFYVSIDGNPQITGGTVAPFTGAALTTQTTDGSAFDTSVPNDLGVYQALVTDLVWHLVVEKGYPITYFGFWNEPVGTSFWAGSQAQYNATYAAFAAGVKAVSGALQVGGPEIATINGTPDLGFVSGLITYCQANTVPLDFISFHHYSGNIGDLSQLRQTVDAYRASAGFVPALPLLCGEFAWNGSNLYGSGHYPFQTHNYFVNDWAAAWVAQQMMECQRLGVVLDVLTASQTEARGAMNGWTCTGLFSAQTAWAPYSVFALWGRLGAQVLTSSGTLPPGVTVLATRDPISGRVAVLLACLRYRTDTAAPLALTVSGVGAARVRYSLIDATHSNAWDTNTTRTTPAVDTVTPPAMDGSGTLQLSMRGRSVHLLEFVPPYAARGSYKSARGLDGGIYRFRVGG